MKNLSSRHLRVAGCGLAGLLGLTNVAVSAVPVKLETVLRAQVPRDIALFGSSVALSEDEQVALVGAPLETSRPFNMNSGAAYVFVRENSGWELAQMLANSDNDGGDRFGSSVALSSDGQVALIGAVGEDCVEPDSFLPGCGAAYIFVRSGPTWIEEAALSSTEFEHTDQYGAAVALSADGATALVGAPLKGRYGEAFVYVRNGTTWTEQARLSLLDPQVEAAELGTSVALSADGATALVGAQGEDCGVGHTCGAAYVFERTGGTWTQVGRLAASAPTDFARFGTAVALSGDGALALIGEPGTNCGTHCGSAHLFARGSGAWTEIQRLVSSDRFLYAQFGASVALARDGSAALIGDPAASCSVGLGCGAVYRFVPQGSLWTEDARILAPSPGLFGTSVAFADHASTLLIGASAAPCPPPPCQGPGCPSFVACGASYIYSDFSILTIPTLSGAGFALLIVALAGLSLFRLRRRSVRQ